VQEIKKTCMWISAGNKKHACGLVQEIKNMHVG
jgi:hypothetical protein